MMQKFEAKLHRPEGRVTWTYVTVPFNVEGTFDTRGRVPVSGKIDDKSFRGSLLPHGSGRHILVIKKAIRDQIGKHSGSTVKVELELDETPRKVAVPMEFSEALSKAPKVKAIFEKLSYSRQKEFAEWIGSAKKPTTKERRAVKAIEMISLGTRLKS